MKTQEKLCDVVILQFNEAMRRICTFFLEKRGFTEGVDFVIVGSSYELRGLMKTEGPQLLVTGIFRDGSVTLKAFIEGLRSKNPELVVVSYSTENLDGSFDRVIHKTIDVQATLLINTVNDFREGKLRRK